MSSAAAAAAEESELHDELGFDRVRLSDSAYSLRQLLDSCSRSLEAEDFPQSEAAVRDLADFVDSVWSSAQSNAEDEISKRSAFNVLSEIRRFMVSPASNQAVIDSLSFVLPKVIVKFAGLSTEYWEVADSIVDDFVSVCNPRDMLAILCEALDALSQVLKAPACYVPLLRGLSKVILSIRRRQFEQIKVAVPVVLVSLKSLSEESDIEDKASLRDLYSSAINIANSIQTTCEKLDGRAREELQALLGLYVLQLMALVANGCLADRVSSCVSFAMQLSHFHPFCGLSYLDLITGYDVDRLSDMITVDESGNSSSCFSSVKNGAALAVIWGCISDDIAKEAGEDLANVKNQLHFDQNKRWQALGMLRHVLSSIDQLWEFKSHAIDFLLSILDGNISEECNGNPANRISDITNLFIALQAVERVIMHAPDALLRKKAFTLLKRILADIPPIQRLDMLKALITNSHAPSMIALLIDIVREEIRKEDKKMSSIENGVVEVNNKSHPSSPFWSSDTLDLVGLILKPPKGGPPLLPENSDAVVSALNLYRYLLIRESTGKTNYTGVLSESNLRKAYGEWLLPLRSLTSGIEDENQKDSSQFAADALCALNPIQLKSQEMPLLSASCCSDPCDLSLRQDGGFSISEGDGEGDGEGAWCWSITKQFSLQERRTGYDILALVLADGESRRPPPQTLAKALLWSGQLQLRW